MGYTVSGPHRNKLYHHPAVRVQPPVIGKTPITQPVAKGTSPPPLPAKEEPVEALTFSQKSEPEMAVQEGESGKIQSFYISVHVSSMICFFAQQLCTTQRGVASHRRAVHVREHIVLHAVFLKFDIQLLADAENTMERENALA